MKFLVAILILFGAFCTQGHAQTLVQHCANEAASNTAASCSPSTNIVGGDTLIVWCRATYNNSVSVSDTLGNTFSTAVSTSQSANPGANASVFYVISSKAGSDTVTCTAGGTSNVMISASEWNGLTALDKTAGAVGASASGNSGSTAATANAVELLYGACSTSISSGSMTYTAGSGFTILDTDTAFLRLGATEYQKVTVTGTYAANMTFSTSNNWGCAIATFSTSAVVTSHPAKRVYAY